MTKRKFTSAESFVVSRISSHITEKIAMLNEAAALMLPNDRIAGHYAARVEVLRNLRNEIESEDMWTK